MDDLQTPKVQLRERDDHDDNVEEDDDDIDEENYIRYFTKQLALKTRLCSVTKAHFIMHTGPVTNNVHIV